MPTSYIILFATHILLSRRAPVKQFLSTSIAEVLRGLPSSAFTLGEAASGTEQYSVRLVMETPSADPPLGQVQDQQLHRLVPAGQ